MRLRYTLTHLACLVGMAAGLCALVMAMLRAEARDPSSGRVVSLLFDSAETLFTGLGDGSVNRWSVGTKPACQQLAQLRGPVDDLGLSADGRLLRASANGSVHVWDVETSEKIRVFGLSSGWNRDLVLPTVPVPLLCCAKIKDTHLFAEICAV
jgi:WD40 repeat protein